METVYHNPVLLEESLGGLLINPKGIYVDATFGGGGHSQAILDKLTDGGKLIAFDKDIDAQANIIQNPALLLVHHDYAHIKNYLRYFNLPQVDGILADLGISSHQVDTAERGFSFRFDAPLDMRMDHHLPRTAADLINDENASTLQEYFGTYGEVKNARTLAKAIANMRKIEPIDTTFKLLKIIESVLPAKENLRKYAAPVFQALRIAVNDELNALKSFLTQSYDVLKPGGRLAVITYHSLEDRIVKNALNESRETDKNASILYGKTNEKWKTISRKPILPSESETNINPRARSAKLRIAEKI